MVPIRTQQNYRDILKLELEHRCQRNSKYSLRSFARDLSMTAGNLSDILRGRHGLSVAKAEMIAEKLGYATQEREFFCDLVRSEHHRSPAVREKASLRLKEKYHPMPMDALLGICEWQHFAILELIRVKDFKPDPKWIAQRLGLSEKVISQSIQNLVRLGLIEEKAGKLQLTNQNIKGGTQTRSDVTKRFHQKTIHQALNAVEVEKSKTNSFSAIVIALKLEDLPAAQEAIRMFRKQFDETFRKPGEKDSVHCMALQFFEISQDDATSLP